MRQANYKIVSESSDSIVIKDMGPWDKYPTITNDAEVVVERLGHILAGRRLFYIDSEEVIDELVVKNGRFAGFKPGPPMTAGER